MAAEVREGAAEASALSPGGANSSVYDDYSSSASAAAEGEAAEAFGEVLAPLPVDDVAAEDNAEDGEALRILVEVLAETAVERLQKESPDKVIAFLRQAQELAQLERGELGDSTAGESGGRLLSPTVTLSRAGVALLQCAIFSRSGRHEEALVESEHALRLSQELWCALFRLSSAEGAVATAANYEALRAVLREPPSWLGWAVEVAVQAKQCVALELEFIGNDALLEVADDTSSHRDRVDSLHRDSVMLADVLLSDRHPLRKGSVDALIRRLDRQRDNCADLEQTLVVLEAARLGIGFDDPADSRLLAALTGVVGQGDDCEEAPVDARTPRPRFLPVPSRVISDQRAQTARMMSPGACMPKVERLYRGVKPFIDPRDLREQYLSTARASSSGLSRLASTAPARSSMGSLDLPASGSLGATGSSMLGSTSLTAIGAFGALSEAINDEDLRPPSKFERMDAPPKAFNAKREGLALRRVYCTLNMSGPGGRANWALRHSEPRKKQTGKKLDPFEDYKKTVYGSAEDRLKNQVMKTDKGVRFFQDNLRYKSDKFKRFWLREEVDPIHLHDDRVLYSAEGMLLKRRQGTLSASSLTASSPTGFKRSTSSGSAIEKRKRPAGSPRTAHAGQLWDLKEMLVESQIQAGLRKPAPVVPKPKKEDMFAGLSLGPKATDGATDGGTASPDSAATPLMV
eukprot:TRINITY_DN13760_c1_g2_i1.p1 TRINITY_DN13760_c1_g2~~TRINITY_DN13760_c1_g2_i1.p1  ORF type:complete len:710 (+),score=178.71 TRINITY_DN13760_c1_g2_i1:68-2131(+)